MSVKHLISRMTPSLTHQELYAVTNRTPSPAAMQRIAAGFNHVSCRQKKVVLFRMQNYRAIPAVTGSPREIWPCFFRTGENTTALVVYVGVTTTPYVAGSPPKLTVLVNRESDDVTVGEASLTYDGGSAGSTVTPDEVSYKKLVISGLSPNTEYYLVNEIQDGMAVLYMMVREASVRHGDDSVTGVCSPDKFANQGPIYDEHVEDLVDANNRLWKHNGAHLLSVCCDYEASTTAPGVLVASGSTSYTDVLSAQPFTLPLQYHNTRRRTTVPLRLAVNAHRTAGTGTLDIRITDGTNSIAVTGLGAGGLWVWAVAAGALPAATASFHIEARQSNLTTTHRIYGISLFEYEA